MRQWRVQAQKQWGEIANRLGTFVEDIVAPNIPRIGNVPDHVVKYCTRHRIYALGLGPETMQLLNRIDMLPSSAPQLEFRCTTHTARWGHRAPPAASELCLLIHSF